MYARTICRLSSDNYQLYRKISHTVKPLRHDKIQKYQLAFSNIKPNEIRNTVIGDDKKINRDVYSTKYSDDDLRRARNMLKAQQEELFVDEWKIEIWILISYLVRTKNIS